jgi:competence protein ComEC
VAVLDQLEVGELWTCWHEEPDPWHARLLAAAARRGVKVARPRALRRGAVTVTPLWPRGFEGACGDPGFSANDNSIVLRLTYGRAAVLLTGDIERPVEAELLRAGAGLRADLLKVPHHGSDSSSSEALIRAVRPSLAVISSGPGNAFGLPDPETLERYGSAGVTVARTDRVGAIGVELTADGALSWRPLVTDLW